MDYLRVAEADGGDARWLALTFAQWSCVAVLVYGLWMTTRLMRGRSATA